VTAALPAYSIEQNDAALLVQDIGITTRWLDALPALYRKSGVLRRKSVLLVNGECGHKDRQTFYPHSSIAPKGPTTAARMLEYDLHAKPLLMQACESALTRSDVAASALTHLVTVSCTGFSSPGIDHGLIDGLGLGQDTQRFHIGFMGCHGLLNGLRVANAIVEADSSSCVLVGAVELCTLHQQYSEDPQQLVANSLFADGAAGLIVTGQRGAGGHITNGWQFVSTKSWMIPGTKSHMAWTVGDYGFEMKLSAEVPSIIQAHLRDPIASWLQTVGLTLGDVDSWAIHPGGPRILDAVEQAFELEKGLLEPSRHVLAEHGNMSSPTVAFLLEQLSVTKAQRCLMIAFGPGLHAEMILLERP
jgi:predicted naringenin-chalcone synthase